MSLLVSNNGYTCRNIVLEELVKNDKDMLYMHIGAFTVIDKAEESVFKLNQEDVVKPILGTSGKIIQLSDNITKKEYKILNNLLTNYVNRKLVSKIDGVWITDYNNDIEELLSLSKSNSHIKMFIDELDTSKLVKCSKDVEEEFETLYGLENVKMLGLEDVVKFIVVPKYLIPKNNLLENGRTLALKKGNVLFDYLEPKLDNENNIIYVEDTDMFYVVEKSVYGYFTIRKTFMQEFFTVGFWEVDKII